MEYENALLIGGPRDGERMSVLAGVPDVCFAQMTSLDFNSQTNEPVPYENIYYRRHPMHTSQGLKTAVYVFGDIDPLAALIDGYRPAK